MTNSFTTNDRSGDEGAAEQSPEAQKPGSQESSTVRELAAGSQQEARDEYVKDLQYQRRYTPATALSVGFKPLKDGGGGITGFQIVFDKETSERIGSAGDVSHGGVEEVASRFAAGIASGIARVEHVTHEIVEGVAGILNHDQSHPRSQHTPDDVVDPFEMPMRGEWVEGGAAVNADPADRGDSAIKVDPYQMPMRGEWVQGSGAETAADVLKDDPYQMPVRGDWSHLADYQREMTKVQEKAASDEKFRRLAEDLKKSGDFVLGGKAAKPDDSEAPSLPPLPKPIMPVAHDVPTPLPLPKPIQPLAPVLPTIEPMSLSHPEQVVLPQITPRQLALPLPENMVPQPIHLSTNDAAPIVPMQSHLSESVSVAPAPIEIERTRTTIPSPVPMEHNSTRPESPPPTPTRPKSADVVSPMIMPVVTAPLEPVHGDVKNVEPPLPVRASGMPPPINLMPSVPREAAPAIEAPHVEKVESVPPSKVFSLGVQDNHLLQQAPPKPYASIYSLPSADRMRLIGAAANQGLKRTLQAGVSEHTERRPVLSGGAEQSGHLERPMSGRYACSNGKDSFEMNLTLPPGSSKNGPISTTVGGFLNVNRQRVVSSTQLDGRIVTDANGTRYEGSLSTYTGGQLRFTAERVVIPFRSR